MFCRMLNPLSERCERTGDFGGALSCTRFIVVCRRRNICRHRVYFGSVTFFISATTSRSNAGRIRIKEGHLEIHGTGSCFAALFLLQRIIVVVRRFIHFTQSHCFRSKSNRWQCFRLGQEVTHCLLHFVDGLRLSEVIC